MDEALALTESAVANFRAKVKKYSHQTAAITADNGDTLTFSELHNLAEKIALVISEKLKTKSEKKRPLVALLIEHNTDLLVTMYAVNLSGAAFMPLDTRNPTERIQPLLDETNPFIIIADNKNLPVANTLGCEDCTVLPFAQILDTKVKGTLPLVPDESPAYLLTTSGTTGKPKAICHTQTSLYRAAYHYQEDLKVSQSDNVGLVLPCHYTPAVFSVFGAWASGATIAPFDLKSSDVNNLINWIEKNEITLLYVTPTIFKKIITQCEYPEKLASIRNVQMAGEPLFTADLKEWREKYAHLFSLYNGMGTSETSCLTRLTIQGKEDFTTNRVPAGKPYADVEILIVDSNNNPVDHGAEGEVQVVADYLPEGYLNSPEKTAERFQHLTSGKTLYKTGDRGYFQDNGNLVILGRADGQIKIRGQRVELSDIESNLLTFDSVNNAAVAYYEPEGRDPFIAAFVSPEIEKSKLREYLSKKLPPYMIPTRIVSMAQLPQLSTGKIDRKTLQGFNFTTNKSTPDAVQEPENIFETRVLDAFRDALKDDSYQLDDDFFEHGGDSFTSVDLSINLYNQLCIPINVSSLIEAPTPRLLANLIIKNKNDGKGHSLMRFSNHHSESSSVSNAVPIFCVPGMFGNALSFRALASELVDTYPVYAFEYPGYLDGNITFSTVDELVNLLYEQVVEVHPKGDCCILSYSLGGAIGFELAKKLIANGRTIKSFIMLDCFSPTTLSIRHYKQELVRFIGKVTHRKRAVWEIRDDNVNRALTTAILNHRFSPCEIPNTTLVIAQDDKNYIKNKLDFGDWPKLIKNDFQIIRTAGNHLDLVMPEKAEEVSQLIRQCVGESAGPIVSPVITIEDKLKKIWSFDNEQRIETKQAASDSIPTSLNQYLKNSEQLTRYLERDLNEKISPITMKSVQVGNFYYRRVNLETQKTNKTVVSAVLKISMSDLPKAVVKDIIDAETPFGRILDRNAIDYSCNVEDVFEVAENFNPGFNGQTTSANQKLFGRYNCFKNAKQKVFAEVVEILTPDLQRLLNR